MASSAPLKRFSEVRWKDDDDVKSFVECVREEKREQNWEHEVQGEMNTAHYLGLQNLLVDPWTKRLEPYSMPRHRANLVHNHIQHNVETALSKIGFDRMVFDVQPATNSPADSDVARISTQVLRYYADYFKYETRIAEMVDRWAMLHREAFVKVIWDPMAGGPFSNQQFDDERIEQLAEHLDMTPDRVRRELRNLQRGDLRVYVVPTNDIYWGPQHAEWEEREYVIETHEQSAACISERYDIPVDEIKDIADSRRIDEEERVWRYGVFGREGPYRSADRQDSLMVTEIWVKPNQRIDGLEDGRHCVVLGGEKVIRNRKNPYNHRSDPYHRFPMIPVPGQVHATTPVEQMLKPQADINSNVSQGAETRETIANPFILAHENSLREDTFTNQVGGIRYWRGTREPKVVEGRDLPRSVMAQRQEAQSAMEDAIGVHEASRGVAPARGKSGKYVMALQGKDDARLGVLVRRRQEFHQGVGRMMLEVAAQFVTEQRVATILGDSEEYLTIQWSGRSLLSRSDGPGVQPFNVRVRTSGMARSREAMLEMLDRLLGAGFLRPDSDSDRQLVFEVLDIGYVGKRIDPRYDSINNARRESLEMIESGEVKKPNAFDDHSIEVDEHTRFLRKHLHMLEPQQAQVVMQHIVLHRYEIERDALAVMKLKEAAAKNIDPKALLDPNAPGLQDTNGNGRVNPLLAGRAAI